MGGHELPDESCLDGSKSIGFLNQEIAELEGRAEGQEGYSQGYIRQPAEVAAARVLIVDHDSTVAHIFRQTLIEAQHWVESAEDIEHAADAIARYAPHCIIVNLYPRGNERPFSLIDEIRSRFQGPVIAVSEACSESTRVMAFERGADDYLCAPFGLGEFTARVDALLRRAAEPLPYRHLRVGQLYIDRAARSVRLKGEMLELTSKEFDILVCLAKKPGIVVSAEGLLSQVWGAGFVHYNQTLRVHISNLRKKARSVSTLPDFIHSVPGNGYFLSFEQSLPKHSRS